MAIFNGGNCISIFSWHESELYIHKLFITVLNGIDESTTSGIQAQSFFIQDSISLSGWYVTILMDLYYKKKWT